MPFLSACAESDKTSRGIRVHEPPQSLSVLLPRFSLSSKKRGEEKRRNRDGFGGNFPVERNSTGSSLYSRAHPSLLLLLETRINKERRRGRKRSLRGQEGLLLDSPTENGYTRVRILDVLLCRRHPHLKRIL